MVTDTDCSDQRELGWEPKIDLEEGIELLFEWVKENRELFDFG